MLRKYKIAGDVGQELSKMNFQCGEIQDFGLVSGQTAEFWNAKCNDTDTSDTEYVSKTENSENKDSKTDFCKSHPSYQSDPSYPVCLPEKKEACCAENGETDGLGTKGMAGQLSGNRGNDSVKDSMDSYRETIRDNISYSCFQNGRGIEDVDELVELMVDTMMVPDGCTMRIAGMDRPASVVKGCFMKLAHSHIEYVMDCLQKHTGKAVWQAADVYGTSVSEIIYCHLHFFFPLQDNETRKGICVIDLDTVMPGLAINDFGDSIRFGASTALEDEPDLNKVWCDMNLFEIYTRGFIKGCGGRLTRREIELLPMGAKVMTFECGMRFLTDYLQGDTYFKIHRPGQNLDRCRTQFKLVWDMEQKWETMREIVLRCRAD